ncbi:MAG: ATP-binding protein [Clostridiales Family XIII bacterium]|jgi:serine/threonine-protein kinase RsbW|nr:ATP-binding protein [Clostridiales Family XIII bacterium]
MNDHIKLVIPCKPEYVSTVRLMVSSVASRAGFNIEAIEDMKVAVSEACTNIINHSKLCGEDEYRVMCTRGTDRMEILVEDDGVGFDAVGRPEVEQGKISESGLGIFIIKALMDEAEVLSEEGCGTRFLMAKYLTVGEE